MVPAIGSAAGAAGADMAGLKEWEARAEEAMEAAIVLRIFFAKTDLPPAAVAAAGLEIITRVAVGAAGL